MDECWLELESDPGVFTLLLESFGVKDIEVVDYYDRADANYHAFIFLFPWSTAQQQIGTTGVFVNDERVLKKLFFATQTAQNSCGMNALLSIMFNCSATRNQLGSELVEFKKQLDGLTAVQRGDIIGQSEFLLERNNRHASANVDRTDTFINEPELKVESDARRARAKRKSGESRKRTESQSGKKVSAKRGTDSSSNDSDSNSKCASKFNSKPKLRIASGGSCSRPRRATTSRSLNHYVAFIPFTFDDGSTHLLELDGLHSAPIDHGPLASSSNDAFVTRFDEVIFARTSEQPTYVKLAVVPSRLHTARLRLSRLRNARILFSEALAARRIEVEKVREIETVMRETAVLTGHRRDIPRENIEKTSELENPNSSKRNLGTRDSPDDSGTVADAPDAPENDTRPVVQQSADRDTGLQVSSHNDLKLTIRCRRSSHVRSVKLVDVCSDEQQVNTSTAASANRIRHVPVKVTHSALSQSCVDSRTASDGINGGALANSTATNLSCSAQFTDCLSNGVTDRNRNTKCRGQKRNHVESLDQCESVKRQCANTTPETDPNSNSTLVAPAARTSDPPTTCMFRPPSAQTEPILIRTIEHDGTVSNPLVNLPTDLTQLNCPFSVKVNFDDVQADCIQRRIAAIEQHAVDVASIERIIAELDSTMQQLSACVSDEEATWKRYRDEQARRECAYDKFLRLFVAALFRNGDPDWFQTVLYYVVKHPEEIEASTFADLVPNGITN